MAMQKKGILPIGYTLLDYVYCDGSQPYVLIEDHLGDTQLTVEAKVKKDQEKLNENGFAGSAYGGAEFEMYYPANSNLTFGVWPNGTTIKISESFGTVDSLKIRWTPASGVSMRAVGRFRTSTSNYKFYGKFFQYTEWDSNDVMIHDLLPCISPENVVGFYDVVGKQFYAPPVGSSAFIASTIAQ